MHGVVDEHDRNLLPEARRELGIAHDRPLDERHLLELGHDILNHHPRVIAQVAAGPAQKSHRHRRHAPRLRIVPMLVGMSEPAIDAGPAERAPHPTPVLAFFDVDNTLMRGASIYHLGAAAWKRGYVSFRDIARFAWQQARFIAVGENHQHQLTARDRALELVAGHSVADLEQLAVEAYETRIKRLLLPETVARALGHRAQGHEVWLITATPEACAAVIADRLQLTGAIGSRIESIDGTFTGKLVGHVMHGQHKAAAAAELAAQKGVNLEDCWAYSDSHNDIPLLELVGHRVVVNPDAALARYAAARGWPVVIAGAASIRVARRSTRQAQRALRSPHKSARPEA